MRSELQITFRCMPPSEALCEIVRATFEGVAFDQPFSSCRVVIDRAFAPAHRHQRAIFRVHVDLYDRVSGTRVLMRASDERPELAVRRVFGRMAPEPAAPARPRLRSLHPLGRA